VGLPGSPGLLLGSRSGVEEGIDRLCERRASPRLPVNLQLLYVSDNLTVEAVARDLSLGGVFVATDLLDEVSTQCDITFLPDARPAVQFRGIVCRVEKSATLPSCPPGMGIRFTHWGPSAREWLEGLIKILTESAPG
jgi:hypothetical protein